MKILKNENLLRLILSSIGLHEIRLLFNKLKNKTINSTILKVLNYHDIFRSIGKSRQVLQEQGQNTISLVTVLSNGNIISAYYGTLSVWDINNNKDLNTLNFDNDIIFITALPDNNVFICLQNSTVKIWDTGNSIITTKLEEYTHFFDALLLSNGNIACLANNHDDNVCILILDSKNSYECLKTQVLDIKEWYWVDCLKPISNKMFASCCYQSSTFMVWGIEDDYQCLKVLKERIYSICLVDHFLLTGGDEDIKIYDTSNGFEFKDSLRSDNGQVNSLIYVQKNNLLLSGFDNSIKVWDTTNSFQFIKTIEIDRRIHKLVLLKQGYFAVSHHEAKISLWDFGGFVCIGTFDSIGWGLHQLISLSDARIVYSTLDSLVIVWGY
jgi:hypothetical protein